MFTQEVWQTDPEAPARGSRVCSKLCELQGFEKGWCIITTLTYRKKQRNLRVISTKGSKTCTNNWQLIKKLSATPTFLPQNDVRRTLGVASSQSALQANKATFFFQLVSFELLDGIYGRHAK